jgi:DNA-binding protein YbaB
MGTEMRAEIQSMLNEYRDMRARMVSLTSELAALTATASSADGIVTATVNPHGEMVALSIDERIVRRTGLAPLVPSILEATGRASREVRARARGALQDFLPTWLREVVRPDGSVDVGALLPHEPAGRPGEAR